MTCCSLCHTTTAITSIHCCSWDTKVVTQLGLEGSPVLESTDVQSSAPKQSMPEVHGLQGFPALESTGALLSPSTQPILASFPRTTLGTRLSLY